MSEEKKTLRVITTLDKSLVDLIDAEVATGDFSSRGHWLRKAAIKLMNGKAGGAKR